MFVLNKECRVCYESLPRSSFREITVNCDHGLFICKSCVSKHISTQLDSKGDVGINCPFDNCGENLEYHDVKKQASKEVFDRYDTLTLLQALRQMPEFRWCKNSGCGSGQIHFEGDDAPIMTCEACGEKSCYTHDVPWHKDLTCDEYDVNRRGEDEATQDMLDRETKPCPKCGVRIIKYEGCNHMTCRISSCKYEFCWLCSADFNEIRANGNTSHKSTCQLYA
ncbi:92_t:CDS:2 [Funneliformis geosporum]|uniref:RBR-type E3 ubiquitin transferase n=1 Tax=Funneliformis geosporum TaxID=1117311 RepID=A0A9W4WXU0_9GLOM|nr:92_t:CDS:2 [Funneliformis geosporum]CAI2180273.1 16855_t:CDS:2 [Funneliformis geosporum]